MRVIGGSAKGRRLLPVPGSTTRPILDRVKTALFDTLRPQLPNTLVLDLFAGSGSVGIEALSQGAKHCTFLDLEPKAIETIRANLETTGFVQQAEVRKMDAFRFVRNVQRAFDLIYVAPPQYQNLWEEMLSLIAERSEILSPNGVVIVQIDPKEWNGFHGESLQFEREKRYGNTALYFFNKKSLERSE